MAEGVILKLSTEAATRSMSDFDRAALAAFRTMEQQSGVLKQLEQQFARQAAAEETAARAAKAAADARRKAAEEAAAALDRIRRAEGAALAPLAPGRGGNLNPLGNFIPNPADVKKSQDAIGGVARGAATAAPLVQKFAGALGGSSGLGKALGAVGGAAQLFLGAINPLYVAVGLAAAAIGDLAIKALTAESPLQKVKRQAKEAQEQYDLLADSVGRATDAIGRAATSRRGEAGTGSFADRFESANQTLQGLKQAQAELDRAAALGATSQTAPLTLPQIADLAEALGKTGDVIKAIGDLSTATGQEYDRALARVRASGLDIGGDRQVDNPLLFDRLIRSGQSQELALERRGVPTLDPGRAEEIIANALGEAATRVQQLLIERAREQFQGEIRQLGQRALTNQGVVRQAGYQSADQFNRVNQDLARQIEFTGASGAERQRLQLEQRIRASQEQAGVAPASAAGEKIAGQIRELTKTEETVRALEEIKDVGRDAFQTIAQGLGDAVLQGKNLRQTLSGLGSNLSSLLLNRAIGAATNSIFGQPGGQAQLGRVLPSRWMMGGGVLDRSQTIVSGGYAINVAEGGGASPEAVIPLARDQFGRLGVRGEGGGGGVVVVNLPNVRSGADARAVRPTLSQTIESVNRRGRRTLRAGR